MLCDKWHPNSAAENPNKHVSSHAVGVGQLSAVGLVPPEAGVGLLAGAVVL